MKKTYTVLDWKTKQPIIDFEMDLVELTGTEKQIAWATDIREKTILELIDRISQWGNNLDNIHNEFDADLETLNRFTAWQSSSAWWIENGNAGSYGSKSHQIIERVRRWDATYGIDSFKRTREQCKELNVPMF